MGNPSDDTAEPDAGDSVHLTEASFEFGLRVLRQAALDLGKNTGASMIAHGPPRACTNAARPMALISLNKNIGQR